MPHREWSKVSHIKVVTIQRNGKWWVMLCSLPGSHQLIPLSSLSLIQLLPGSTLGSSIHNKPPSQLALHKESWCLSTQCKICWLQQSVIILVLAYIASVGFEPSTLKNDGTLLLPSQTVKLLAGHMVRHMLCHMIRHMFCHLIMTHHPLWLVMWSALIFLSSATLLVGCHTPLAFITIYSTFYIYPYLCQACTNMVCAHPSSYISL